MSAYLSFRLSAAKYEWAPPPKPLAHKLGIPPATTLRLTKSLFLVHQSLINEVCHQSNLKSKAYGTGVS